LLVKETAEKAQKKESGVLKGGWEQVASGCQPVCHYGLTGIIIGADATPKYISPGLRPLLH
jgi:hypothetical protein